MLSGSIERLLQGFAGPPCNYSEHRHHRCGVMENVRSIAAALLVASALACASAQQSSPSPVGADPRLERAIASADSMVEAALGTLIPGAVLLVAKDGKVIHERTYGYAELNDYSMRGLASPRPMRTTTLFDLASVTKVMATTFAVMLLVDRGR